MNTRQATVVDMGGYNEERARAAIQSGIVSSRVSRQVEPLLAKIDRQQEEIELLRATLHGYRRRRDRDRHRAPGIPALDAAIAGFVIGGTLTAALWWGMDAWALGGATLADATCRATIMGTYLLGALPAFVAGQQSIIMGDTGIVCKLSAMFGHRRGKHAR